VDKTAIRKILCNTLNATSLTRREIILFGARQQNSWVQREEVSSRQDAKNAKESTILFQPTNDGSDALHYECLVEFETLVLDFPWRSWRLGEIQKDLVPE
jgi:hypothetical protein